MSRQRKLEVIQQAEDVTIGELVRLTDVRYSTLKYYTEEGMLPFQQAEENLTRRYKREASIRRIRRSNTSREATAQRPWAISVAHATPATPMPKRITNSRSSTMFVRLEFIRKIRGVLLSPWAL